MSKPQINRLCQEIGHQWDTATVIKDYRRCTRAECKTAQRLVRGRWRDVTARTRSQAAQSAIQPTLFTPGRDFYDNHEIRRAELAYLDILGR